MSRDSLTRKSVGMMVFGAPLSGVVQPVCCEQGGGDQSEPDDQNPAAAPRLSLCCLHNDVRSAAVYPRPGSIIDLLLPVQPQQPRRGAIQHDSRRTSEPFDVVARAFEILQRRALSKSCNVS